MASNQQLPSRGLSPADRDAFAALFRSACREFEAVIKSVDLEIFNSDTPPEPSERGREFSVRNSATSTVGKITEVAVIFLAFIYRNNQAEENRTLYDTIIRDIYGFSGSQMETIHRVARKFSLIKTIYQSAVFNQALASFLLEHYWNPDLYPNRQLPPYKKAIQDGIARYLGEIPTLEEHEINEIMEHYSGGAARSEDGHELPEIIGEEQMQMATTLSERVEKVSNFLTKLRDLYAPQDEMVDVDSFIDGIILH